VLEAPEPDDILWENIGMEQTVETLRKVLVFVGVIMLMLVLTTPTALLSTLKSVSFVSQSSDDVTGYLANLLRRVREFSPKVGVGENKGRE
jgi:hypothetical protein